MVLDKLGLKVSSVTVHHFPFNRIGELHVLHLYFNKSLFTRKCIEYCYNKLAKLPFYNVYKDLDCSVRDSLGSLCSDINHCRIFVESTKTIHFWKPYSISNQKNNVSICPDTYTAIILNFAKWLPYMLPMTEMGLIFMQPTTLHMSSSSSVS